MTQSLKVANFEVLGVPWTPRSSLPLEVRYLFPMCISGVSVAPEFIQMTATHLHVDKLCFKLSKYFLLSNFNKKKNKHNAELQLKVE